MSGSHRICTGREREREPSIATPKHVASIPEAATHVSTPRGAAVACGITSPRGIDGSPSRMLPALRRAAAVAALGAATSAATKISAACDASHAPSSFDGWKASLHKRLGATAAVDFEAQLQPFTSQRKDKYFLWQTLREGDRRIRSVAAWRWTSAEAAPAVTSMEGYDPVPGRARMSVLVQLGDELNGHEGIIHGGFTAALLDDLIGWTTMAETEAQQLPGAPLTASLNLKYLRPVFGDRTYLANMRAVSVARRQRPGPPSWAVTLHADIVDAEGNVCVSAEALYVVKQFTAASLEKASSSKGG